MRNLLFLSFLDSPRFLFTSPNRCIFTERKSRILPSSPPLMTNNRLPGQHQRGDSDSAGEIDDSEASRVQLDKITGDQAGQDCRNLDG